MAEIIGGLLAGIGGFMARLARLYPAWLLADFIMGGLSLLYVAATGGLAGFLGEVAVNAAIGAIPFPFNLLAIFYISPVYLVLQIILFLILLMLFFKSSND